MGQQDIDQSDSKTSDSKTSDTETADTEPSDTEAADTLSLDTGQPSNQQAAGGHEPGRSGLGRGLLFGAAMVAGGLVVARKLGQRRWRRRTAAQTARLKAAAGEPAAGDEAVGDEAAVDAAPPVVERYLLFAGVATPRDAAPDAVRGPLRRARLRQKGVFRRLDPENPAAATWKPFTAVQHMSASPPAFVWDARIRMAPLAEVRVRDGYVGGRGTMRAELAAMVPLVDATPCAELDAGSLQRFLAEAVWLPTALRPFDGASGSLCWRVLDDSGAESSFGAPRERARATLRDGDTEVSLDFTFDRRGAILEARGTRYREVGGRAVPTPWICRYFDWVRVGGVRVPRRGEVAWVLDTGDGDSEQSYWRGRVVELEFDDYAV